MNITQAHHSAGTDKDNGHLVKRKRPQMLRAVMEPNDGCTARLITCSQLKIKVSLYQ